jgi:hypothetical protein
VRAPFPTRGRRSRGSLVLACLVVAACTDSSGSGSDRRNPGVAFVVTFSATATKEAIDAFPSRLHDVAGVEVESSRVSPATLAITILGSATPGTQATIERELEASPIVCLYCQSGTGCLNIVMKKPGCR